MAGHDAGINLEDVAIGDLNGDCLNDLVVADGNGHAVNVLLGRGDGTFGSPLVTPTPSLPSAVAIADLNGDGWADVAVAQATQTGVGVLLGAGGGAFRPLVTYPAGKQPADVKVADFNLDGHLDLAVLNSEPFPPPEFSVGIYLGDGDGGFGAQVVSPAATGPASTGPRRLAVGDFNGDSKPDLALSLIANVSVMLGRGDGTFDAHVEFPISGWAEGVTTIDYDRDGKVDIVAGMSVGGPMVTVLLGSGTGTFPGRLEFGDGGQQGEVVALDLNLDGLVDVATHSYQLSQIRVFLGGPDGGALAPRTFPIGRTSLAIAAGDLTGDGRPDLVTTDFSDGQVSLVSAACY